MATPVREWVRGRDVAHRSMPSEPKREAHEEQLSEMHDALYQLGDQARPPMSGSSSKLLPDHLQPEKPGAESAKKHIAHLHRAFKKAKGKNKEK